MPMTNEEKIVRIRSNWGDAVPSALWFDLGSNYRARGELITPINRQLFPDRPVHVPPIALTISDRNNPDCIAGHGVLFVSNATKLVLEVEFHGVKYPLYLAGDFEDPERRVDLREAA